MEAAGPPRVIFQKLSGLVTLMGDSRSRYQRHLGRIHRGHFRNHRSINPGQTLVVIAAVVRCLHVVAAAVATAVAIAIATAVAIPVRIATVSLAVTLAIAATAIAATAVIALAVSEGLTVEAHVEAGIHVTPEALEALA